MKLRYILATVAVAAASSVSMADEPVNLMADWAQGTVNKYPGEDGSATNWVAYNIEGNVTGNGNGWQYRNVTGELNGSGEVGVLFLRWNDNDPKWYYGYKFTAVENHSYTLTLEAWVNDGKQTSLKVGACAAPINNSKNTPVQEYVIDPEVYTTAGANYSTGSGLPVSYEFTATASGDYYVFFGALKSPNKPGNLIIATSKYLLVDNGEVQVTLEQYNALLEEAKAFLANEMYANVTGEERTALAALTDAAETPEDLNAAYEALNEALSTFREAKGAYDSYAVLKARAESEAVKPLYENAPQTYQSEVTSGMSFTPQSAADALEAAAMLEYAVREAIIGQVAGEGYAIELEGAMMPEDGVVPGVWTKDGDGKVRMMNNEAPDVWNMFKEYYDTDNWGSKNWSAALTQSLTLQSGKKYTLVLTARSSNVEGQSFELFAGNDAAALPAAGNQDNTLGRGWALTGLHFETPESDSSTVAVPVGVRINVGDSDKHWFSFNDFRLVCNGNLTSGVSVIGAENAAEAVYYNLNGVRVDGSSLTPGVYVQRRGSETVKVLVK